MSWSFIPPFHISDFHVAPIFPHRINNWVARTEQECGPKSPSLWSGAVHRPTWSCKTQDVCRMGPDYLFTVRRVNSTCRGYSPSYPFIWPCMGYNLTHFSEHHHGEKAKQKHVLNILYKQGHKGMGGSIHTHRIHWTEILYWLYKILKSWDKLYYIYLSTGWQDFWTINSITLSTLICVRPLLFHPNLWSQHNHVNVYFLLASCSMISMCLFFAHHLFPSHPNATTKELQTSHRPQQRRRISGGLDLGLLLHLLSSPLLR